MIKRIFDVAVSAVALVLASPLLAAAAIWIKLDSRGPVFYRGVRAGLHGKPFRIWKLRTMVPDAEQRGGAETPADDPRITRAGDFLRRYKLDELPQLLNVLTGEMSMVGPRPEVMDEVAAYDEQQRRLLDVKPGITDWASILFRNEDELLRGSSDPHRDYHLYIRPEKIRLGLQYVDQHSLLTDVAILARTAMALAETRVAGRRAFGMATNTIPIDTTTGSKRVAELALAADGGAQCRTEEFAPWPVFEEDEIEAVRSVLRSGKVNYWTGSEGGRFEEEFAGFVGCKHAVALANGTVALELALHALGIGPGDEVVVPSRTFVASAGAILLRGATPVFADVDPLSQNITAASIAAVLTPRSRAVIVVHLAGWPCDMDPILQLARERGLKVIEDCAQALGARYHGRPVGSLGDVGAFSFCQDKILTTGGEGGMLVTNDDDVWQRAWSFKDHGKDYALTNGGYHTNSFRWVHESVGTNWRMTEMQAAIGRTALPKLAGWISKRRENAAALTAGLAGIDALRAPDVPAGFDHAFYKFYVFLRPEKLAAGWDRDRVLDAIRAEGVPCFSGTCSEVYLEKAFAPELRPGTRLPIARALGETSLMFLVHPTLSLQDMSDTCRAVKKVLATATIALSAAA